MDFEKSLTYNIFQTKKEKSKIIFYFTVMVLINVKYTYLSWSKLINFQLTNHLTVRLKNYVSIIKLIGIIDKLALATLALYKLLKIFLACFTYLPGHANLSLILFFSFFNPIFIEDRILKPKVLGTYYKSKNKK